MGELFTEVAGESTKVYVAVNVLGYSRRFHVYAAPRNDTEHTCESVARAFSWFGGSTREVWLDNQKAAVLKHVPGAVQFNERFKQLALHYDLRPKAFGPHRARTKGKVERQVRYVKENFLQHYRSFESWVLLNQLLERWLSEVADQRFHREAGEVVTARFDRERVALVAFPATPFDTSYIETRQVPWDAYVTVQGNRYSVPAHCCRQSVTIHISLDNALTVYRDQQCVARHRLTEKGGGWQTVEDHHERLWAEVNVQARPLAVYEEMAHATR